MFLLPSAPWGEEICHRGALRIEGIQQIRHVQRYRFAKRKKEHLQEAWFRSLTLFLRLWKIQQKLKRKAEGKVAKSFRALGREVSATGKIVRKSSPLTSSCGSMNIFSVNRNVVMVMDDRTYRTLDGND